LRKKTALFGILVTIVCLNTLFGGIVSAAAPVANFTATPLSGRAPLFVSFTDLSLYNPTGWTWYFGDEMYTWTKMNDEVLSLSGRAAQSSVVIPDGSIILMGGVTDSGTLKNDVWRSTDNGATWSLVNANAGWSGRAGHSSVVMSDGSIVLMGGIEDLSGGSLKNDVWRSTDNGATWSLVTTNAGWSARAGHSSVVMPDGSIVLMGDSEALSGGSLKNDVWRSTDNGATWSLVNASAGWSGRTGHSSVVVPDGSIVLMDWDTNEVWRATDGGVSWSLVNASVGWSAGNYQCSVVLPDGSIVLMGSWDDSGSLKNDVRRSTDNGATWSLITANAGWSAGSWYNTVVMPDGSIVLMGGISENGRFKADVWRSMDNGATWSQVNASAGWSGRAGHSSVAVPDGSIVLMGGSEDMSGGSQKNDVWRSQDNGATWSLVTANAGWSARSGHSSVVMPDGSIVLMGGSENMSSGSQKNDVWRSEDNGATWSLVTANAGWSGRAGHSSVVMPDGSIVLMGGGEDPSGGSQKNDIWRSQDNGATWSLVTANAGWSARTGHSSVVMPDGSIVLMGGGEDLSGSSRKNDVWRSTDNGATWSLVTANAEWTARYLHSSVVSPDSSIVLMGGYESGDLKNDVWRSQDNGATWSLVTANAGWSGRAGHSSVAMPDGSIVLMGGIERSSLTMNDIWRLIPFGSSMQNPAHTYTTSGIYQVALQTYNTDGYNGTRKEGYIFVSSDETGIDVNPKSVKNTSSSYLTIYGSNFISPMNVELRKQNITIASAKSVVVALSSTLMTTFDLTYVQEGIYDIVVIWPDGTQKTKSAAVTVSAFPEGVLFQNSDMTMSSGETVSYSFDVQPTTHDLFITLQKSTYPWDAHWSWRSEISISHDGNVIASSTSNQDPLLQIKNPEPGPYTITIKATEAGKGILTIRSSLTEMPEGDWVVDTIQRPFGSSFHQVNIPAGMDQLTIEAETINDFSFFRVYYDTYGGSPKWITSYSQTKVTIPHPAAGRYIVEFVDPQVLSSTSQKRDILLRATTELSTEPQPVYNPIISGFTPVRGGNTGTVTLKINGGWLDQNSTVILSDSGAGNLTALSVVGSADRRSLTASLDLLGKSPGSYSLIVQSPTGIAISAPRSFLIEEGGKSELWTELTGMEKIREGRPAKYFLKYGNKGNLDMPAPLAVITSDPPSSALSSRILPNSTWKQMGTDGLTLRLSGPVENPDILPAGSSYTIELQVQSDLSEEFTLNVVPHGGDQVYSPVTLELGTDMAVPGPGLPLMFNRAYPARLSSYSGAMGTGWVHTYDFRLIPIEDGSCGIRSGDIIKTTFSRQDDGSWTDERGNTKITVNSGDGTSTAASSDGSVIKFDSQGLPVLLSDANGNQITLTYTGGKLTQVQHSDGDGLTLSYNGNNRISSVSGPGGQITSYTYSPDGMLLTQVTDTDGRVNKYSYQFNGLGYAIASITRPGNIVENYQYDGDGRLIGSSLNEQKEAVSIQYDENSRSTTLIDSTGSSVGIQVNERGQVVGQENPLGEANQFTYDARGYLTAMADASGNEYQFEHDTSGQVTSITDPLSHVTRYTYDPEIQSVKTITYPRGNTLSFNYDSRSNIIGVMYPDTRSETMSHDSAGNLVTFTSRKGDNLQYTYNSRGQLTRTRCPDGKSVTYSYDTLGNLMEISSENGSITINFNSRNELIHVSYPGGIFFNYTYDSAGRLIEREDKEGLGITYAYDDLGHLLSVGDTSGKEYAHYSYDPAGRISRKAIGNGAYATYAYDPAGRISRLINHGTDGTILSRFDLQYDASGNPVQIGTLEGNYMYSYDALGQLTEVTFPDNSKEHYTYDEAGNRISTTIVGTIISYSTNNMNQYTQAGSESFTYDHNGNLVSRNGNGTTTYEYNYENQLTRVTSPEGTWDYTYDALGNRVVVDNNGTITRYAVDPFGLGMIAAEYYENGTVKSKYVYGLGLVAKTTGNDVYYYDFNPTGHTSEITNKMGSVVNRYQYTPFGSYRQKIEGISNPFTYAGENGVMDDANGLYYMRLRYYLPNLGVFVSEDPSALAGDNLNTYCYNNPVLYSDPFGLDSHKETVWKFGWGEVLTKSISKLEKDVAKLKKLHKAYSQDQKFLKGAKSCEEGLGGLELSIDAYNLGTTIADAQIGKKNKWNVLQDTFKVGGDVVDLVGSPLVKAVKKSAEFGWAVGRILGRTPLLTDPSMTYDQFYQELFSNLFFKKVASVTSVDPENKYGPTGYDPSGTSSTARNRYITEQSPLNYRIDFWNAETATANVCDVDAYDQMDTDLNWSTFQFTEVGFTDWIVPLEPTQYFNVYVDPRPSMPYIVQIEGVYNPATGKANLTYHTLDPTTLETPEDPIAGFLPPISSRGDEIGWFSFTVQPKQGLSTGTTIENQAFVNFDYSAFMPAPKDAPWRNTMDTRAPMTSVAGTLVNQTEIHFTLSGSDDAGGSGIKEYTVYGSDNGGPYTPYLNHITSTSGSITGSQDHTYRFYSIGRDNVGNMEQVKTSPEVTIHIPVPVIVPMARFTASPNSGSAPLTVNFTDQSDNNPTAWNWNFGDGSAWINGTTHALSHTYTGVGNYTAILVVSNTAGRDQIQRTITVTNKALLPLPGFTNPPTDPDNDGLYEDLNANNRKDFNDVVLMFNHMQWIAANEPSGAFDFDFNANGRIDFNDIVKLFGEI
jgi:RHS repeat-associated protein